MSSYNRVTTECPPAELRPPLRQGIQTYFEQHSIGSFEDCLKCCETVSSRASSGWLAMVLSGDRDLEYVTALIVTHEWLIWARHSDHSGTSVSGARLKNVNVRPVKPLLSGDFGLEISGYVEGFSGRLRGTIALGPEPAARQFCDAAAQAVGEAHPKTARTFFGIPLLPRR